MTPARLKHYKSKGWQFRIEDSHDHHTGVPEERAQFKSPRLVASGDHDWSWTYEDSWADVTEQALLKREREEYVAYLTERDFDVPDIIESALLKALKANPSAKTLDITFTVEVKPL